MSDNKVELDLDALDPMVTAVKAEPVQAVDVVFVPHRDVQLTVNQTVKNLRKGQQVKISRDEARILLESNAGYIRD